LLLFAPAAVGVGIAAGAVARLLQQATLEQKVPFTLRRHTVLLPVFAELLLGQFSFAQVRLVLQLFLQLFTVSVSTCVKWLPGNHTHSACKQGSQHVRVPATGLWHVLLVSHCQLQACMEPTDVA
jgi:hypothetical protein